MKSAKALPPAEYLRECFLYDPETGSLTWRDRPRGHFTRGCDHARFQEFVGKIAGAPHFDRNGKRTGVRVRLAFNGKNLALLAHRVIYAWMTGDVLGTSIVDHRNHNPFDNRWENIRWANHQRNGWNKRAWRNKKEGLPKGVYRAPRNPRRFVALIKSGKKNKYLGTFDTPEQASEAFANAAKELHGEFACF